MWLMSPAWLKQLIYHCKTQIFTWMHINDQSFRISEFFSPSLSILSWNILFLLSRKTVSLHGFNFSVSPWIHLTWEWCNWVWDYNCLFVCVCALASFKFFLNNFFCFPIIIGIPYFISHFSIFCFLHLTWLSSCWNKTKNNRKIKKKIKTNNNINCLV